MSARLRPYAFAGGTAVITGAAGGIGEALAHGLAARGSDLVLLDRSAERLDAVAAALRGEHPDRVVRTHVVDLADAGATEQAARAVLAGSPRVTLLVNNAGVALGGRFDQVDLAEFDWVVDVNFRAQVHLAHALLPALLAFPGSHLVNVSSVFGIIAPPGQAAYAASKFAVRGFTEALRSELAPRGVGVTCVHPGGIRTRIALDARVGSGVDPQQGQAAKEAFHRGLSTSPEQAAQEVLRGVERRRARVLIGRSAKLPDVAARLLPSHHLAALGVLDRAARSLRRLSGQPS